jgi:hypothetical protein
MGLKKKVKKNRLEKQEEARNPIGNAEDPGKEG